MLLPYLVTVAAVTSWLPLRASAEIVAGCGSCSQLALCHVVSTSDAPRFECVCPEGYRGDGLTCTAVNATWAATWTGASAGSEIELAKRDPTSESPIQPCGIIYVTPAGTGNGAASSPANIVTAFTSYASTSRNVIRVGTGTYAIGSTLKISVAGLIVEGGWTLSGSTWTKSNANAASTTLNINPAGQNDPNGQGYYMGFDCRGQSGFTISDMTINVQTAGATWRPDGNRGASVYGLYLAQSSNFRLLRLVITTGKAADGAAGAAGSNGAGGGGGYTGGRGSWCTSLDRCFRAMPSMNQRWILFGTRHRDLHSPLRCWFQEILTTIRSVGVGGECALQAKCSQATRARTPERGRLKLPGRTS
eukprot:TRINITY_DN5259_c1_g3_i1.p1 TRINITY_DN5259_c1_g3~~TRINITY_DN5259_c1_g3_i1.p1  ORF type:complete len:362 (+),score=46.77 TRINITY_DN5259_c1_g3_i1:192-1277(+)